MNVRISRRRRLAKHTPQEHQQAVDAAGVVGGVARQQQRREGLGGGAVQGRQGGGGERAAATAGVTGRRGSRDGLAEEEGRVVVEEVERRLQAREAQGEEVVCLSRG